MDLYEQLNKCFPITGRIIKCYDFLVALMNNNLSDINQFIQIVDKIKDLKFKEYQLYNEFTWNEIRDYIGKLSESSSTGMEFRNIRINGKLICTYDRMRGYSINCKEIFPMVDSNQELSITDIINSKINIDTYKIITRKLEELVCSNELEEMYKEKLLYLNMQNYIYKMAIKETSELLIIDSMFNIQNIPDINLNDIEKIYFNKTRKKIDIKKIVEINIYGLVINFLDGLLCSKIDGNDINNIYYNLFMISHVEVLLDYLGIDKLNSLSLYYSRLTGQDKMITFNVKDLIKRKIEDNNSK